MLVGKTLGPFTIDKKLGTGAMGAVYRARHNQSGKWVAIKIINPGLAASDSASQRFEREWEILKQLKHPNIVRLIATGRFSGTPFYAMEYVEGESLDRIMQRRGRISWEEVVRLGQQLCAGLKHAHDMGIVHRDLKPSNLMILKDGTVKLTDFGIAKDLDRTALTEANSTVGTAAYMSPEQCKGERNLTYKSDLYSMGIMFYELLTGRKPFEAESAMEMFMEHVKGKFERPSRLALEVPIFLDTLVCQLMEKDPERRPFDAAMVAEALGRVEEKVAAQQSAGIDAVRTRNRDKPPEAAKVEREDQEAARALLRKKKKKRAQAAFYQSLWFKAAMIAVLLLVILTVFIVVFLVKPSAESLYQRAEQVMASGDLEKKVEARKEGPIYDFLRYYGDRDDDLAHKVRGWADKIDAEECERQVLLRMNLAIKTTVDDQEFECRKAIEAENAGNLKTARTLWLSLVKNKEEPQKPLPSDKRSLGLLAHDRLKLLDKVDEREKKLEKGVTESGFAKGYKPADDNEKKAAEAYQLELQTSPKAREAWEEFQKKFKSDALPTEWWLLAAKRLRDLGEVPKKSTLAPRRLPADWMPVSNNPPPGGISSAMPHRASMIIHHTGDSLWAA
jgi:serine/threonine-protein kinase